MYEETFGTEILVVLLGAAFLLANLLGVRFKWGQPPREMPRHHERSWVLVFSSGCILWGALRIVVSLEGVLENAAQAYYARGIVTDICLGGVLLVAGGLSVREGRRAADKTDVWVSLAIATAGLVIIVTGIWHWAARFLAGP